MWTDQPVGSLKIPPRDTFFFVSSWVSDQEPPMAFQKPPTVSDDYRAQDIYREAAQVIYAKGFDATSMGDIANAVDLTKGGLYYYIKGKKALLFAIMNFAMDLLEREVLTPAKDEHEPLPRLRSLIAGHVQLVIEDPSAMSILANEEEGLDQEHHLKITARKSAYHEFVRGTVERVLTEQGNQSTDAGIATNGLFGMIYHLVRWYDVKGGFGKDEVIEQMTQLALNGLHSPDSA